MSLSHSTSTGFGPARSRKRASRSQQLARTGDPWSSIAMVPPISSSLIAWPATWISPTRRGSKASSHATGSSPRLKAETSTLLISSSRPQPLRRQSSCRRTEERRVGQEGARRVDVGGARNIKKKKKEKQKD